MEEWKIRRARKRVRRIKGFYGHFTSWAVFSAFFIFINLWTDPREFWAIYPIVSWGVGLVFHAVGVFGLPGMSDDWEERMLERELERLERHEDLKRRIQSYESSVSPASKYIRDDEPRLQLKKLRKDRSDSDFV